MLTALLAWTLLLQTTSETAENYIASYRAADQALVDGRLDAARGEFERCLALSPENPTVAYGLACVAARADRRVPAFLWLERALIWGFRDADLAEWDPDLESLAYDERWPPLIELVRATEKADISAAPILRLLPAQESERVTFGEADPTGRLVAQGDSSGRVRLLDAHTGRFVRDLASLCSPVWRIAFHPYGRELAVLTTDGRIHFLRIDGVGEAVTSQALLANATGETPYPFYAYLSYDPTGQHVLARATSRGASLWTNSGQLVRAWPDPIGSAWYSDLAWCSDGRSFAWPQDSDLKFFDAETGEPAGRPLHCESVIQAVAFDSTGELLALGLSDARVSVRKTSTYELLYEQSVVPGFLDTPRSVNSVEFSPDGRRLAYAACESIRIAVVDARSGEVLYGADDFNGHWCEPLGMLWSSSADRLWFSPGCGGSGVEEIDVNAKRWQDTRLFARTPRANPSGLAAFADSTGVACLDTRSNRILWIRPHHDEPDDILQAPSGHFSGENVSLLAFRVVSYGRREEDRPLADCAVRLFDPKRVRAALVGVALVPARL